MCNCDIFCQNVFYYCWFSFEGGRYAAQTTMLCMVYQVVETYPVLLICLWCWLVVIFYLLYDFRVTGNHLQISLTMSCKENCTESQRNLERSKLKRMFLYLVMHLSKCITSFVHVSITHSISLNNMRHFTSRRLTR